MILNNSWLRLNNILHGFIQVFIGLLEERRFIDVAFLAFYKISLFVLDPVQPLTQQARKLHFNLFRLFMDNRMLFISTIQK